MRITVIGSTGHTGRHVLIEALRRDHQGVAFTRRPARSADGASSGRTRAKCKYRSPSRSSGTG
ncbi:hypothetical protein AB0M44_24480 [Streptosporangium subroseum]|uniref:hypothetical protein n=1 Tax=Streptosporangium subroseum TaxID=106412 RepID=UPI00343FB343